MNRGTSFIKICGMTEKRQIDWAVELGYTAVGFVLYEKSPRYVAVEEAKALARHAGDRIKTVAVSLRFNELAEVAPYTDYIQLYEFAEMENLIYAGESFQDCANADNIKYLLYDASRGSGSCQKFPGWLEEIRDRLILSGGLTPDNVRDVIKKHPCAGIDVSSGVEIKRGVKDHALMKQFINEVKRAAE